MAESAEEISAKRWTDLAADIREVLTGRLSGLWGAASDEEAFESCSVASQQALLLLLSRLREKDLWHIVKRIDNVYGEGGVGIEFSAWPFAESTLRGRKDFTSFLASHKGSTAGFYEKGRRDAVLHFLYLEATERQWYVHFDLYSPVYSPASALRHLRHEFIGKLTPDWRMIQERLNA